MLHYQVVRTSPGGATLSNKMNNTVHYRHVRHTLALMYAKNHLLIFSSFLDIWKNVEWPRFFGPPCILWWCLLNSLLPPPKKEVMFSVRSVCLSVCPSDYSQTCERILTKFFVRVGHDSRTKWYNFGGDPDHASDPGVQSLKSGSSGSAEVCAVLAYLVVSCLMLAWHFCVHTKMLLF